MDHGLPCFFSFFTTVLCVIKDLEHTTALHDYLDKTYYYDSKVCRMRSYAILFSHGTFCVPLVERLNVLNS